MGQLLFKLNQVPEDEAQEVRDLLAEHELSTYETHAGFWGLGVSAIWLADAEQWTEAKALLDRYQAERQARQRELRAEQEATGEAPTLWRQALRSPVRFLLMLIAIGVVLTLSLLPFLALMNQ